MPGKKKLVWNLCEWCKKPFQVARTELKRGNGRFCSRSCASKWRVAVGKSGRIGSNQKGPNNANWKGGKTKHTKGYTYIYAPHHPNNHNNYVLEHRLIAEILLGRHLKRREVVHHRDCTKNNNLPLNLKVFHSVGEHTRHHLKGETYGKSNYRQCGKTERDRF